MLDVMLQMILNQVIALTSQDSADAKQIHTRYIRGERKCTIDRVARIATVQSYI